MNFIKLSLVGIWLLSTYALAQSSAVLDTFLTEKYTDKPNALVVLDDLTQTIKTSKSRKGCFTAMTLIRHIMSGNSRLFLGNSKRRATPIEYTKISGAIVAAESFAAYDVVQEDFAVALDYNWKKECNDKALQNHFLAIAAIAQLTHEKLRNPSLSERGFRTVFNTHMQGRYAPQWFNSTERNSIWGGSIFLLRNQS